MKKYRLNATLLVILIFAFFHQSQGLASECGIQYCSSCDPVTKFCYECDLPYKPGYANQSICTRCANNCAVCESPGNDSKGRCLSCMPNFNYSSDDHCDIFDFWIYAVVIASYAVFVIVLFIVFCFIKRRRQKKQSLWFQYMKSKYNKVDSDRIPVLEFQKMTESLVQLIKESSSYNNLKFKDQSYQKAMKIRQIKVKSVPNETHLKKVKLHGWDNSEWDGVGYLFVPSQQNTNLKLWFVKNYKRKVFSEQISKIIVYESDSIEANEIKGDWFYYDSPQIRGSWKGIRVPGQQFQQDRINS